MAESWVPVDACALPTAEQPLRVAEFDDVFADHLESVELLGATGVRMVLAGPEGLAAVVRDLTDRESACCSFFEFRVSEPGIESGTERVVVEVHVPPTHADVVAALAARAAAARR
jgi:hypothetical protein